MTTSAKTTAALRDSPVRADINAANAPSVERIGATKPTLPICNARKLKRSPPIFPTPASDMIAKFLAEISGQPLAIRNGIVITVPTSMIQPITEFVPMMRIDREDIKVLQANITAVPSPKMSAIGSRAYLSGVLMNAYVSN